MLMAHRLFASELFFAFTKLITQPFMKITKSKLSHLLISLLILSSIAVSGGVIAQTVGGGAGGAGIQPGGIAGLDSVSGAGR
jgi:hypothetical protein